MIKFGTDGIRGPAGQAPLDEQTLTQLGCAFALSLSLEDTVIIGRDTRGSGPWIEAALTKGLATGGVNVISAGIMPTGALSIAVAETSAAMGIMITASHNPAKDNGIKILNASGHKPSKTEQAKLLSQYGKPSLRAMGTSTTLNSEDACKHWINSLPKPSLNGLKILVDCAHGAAAPHAPKILRQLGVSIPSVRHLY